MMLSSLRRGLKSFSIITLCNVAVQIISLVGFTIIARLFTPTNLGEYIVYVSYVSIVAILSTGFYEQALFIEKGNRRQPYIIMASIMVAVAVCIFSLFPLSYLIPDYAVFVSLGVFAGAVRVISRSYGIINGKLINIALYDFLTAPILPITFIIGAKYFGQSSSIYLISANSIVTLLTSSILFLYVINIERLNIKHSFRNSVTLSVLILKKYINLPKYKMTAELIAVFSLRLPVIVMDKFFTSSLAAFYGVAFRIAITPVSVLISTIAQMFLHKIRTNRANGILSFNTFISFSLALWGLSAISVLLIFVLSDWVIILLFTEKYSYVSHILKTLSPYVAMLIAVSPLMSTFIIYEKQKYLLIFQLLLFLITALGYSVAVITNNINFGFILFSLASVLVYGYAYFLMFKNYKNESIGFHVRTQSYSTKSLVM